jgi:hypothetical protein
MTTELDPTGATEQREPADGPGSTIPTGASASAPAPEAAAPRRLCPYLVGRSGDWRGVDPSRDHRCAAVDPPAALSTDKQRRLCLGSAHRGCSTFLAARRSLVTGLEDDAVEPGRAPVHRWSLPRTAPVLIERGRPSILRDPRARSAGQVALVILMAVAFILLLVARSG